LPLADIPHRELVPVLDRTFQHDVGPVDLDRVAGHEVGQRESDIVLAMQPEPPSRLWPVGRRHASRSLASTRAGAPKAPSILIGAAYSYVTRPHTSVRLARFSMISTSLPSSVKCSGEPLRKPLRSDASGPGVSIPMIFTPFSTMYSPASGVKNG